MQELKQLVLRLITLASIANGGEGQLCILDAVIFCAAFAKGPPVKSNQSAMSKVSVDTIKSRCVRHSNVD